MQVYAFTASTPTVGRALVYDWNTMTRHSHLTRATIPAWAAGLGLALLLAACQPFWSTPETRARDFIETLVTAPAETQRLRELANLPPEQNPEALMDDLSARVGLDFLRARHAQNVSLKFVAGETRQLNEASHTVMIHVTYLLPGTPTMDEVRFLVRIEKDAQDRWRIARITGDN